MAKSAMSERRALTRKNLLQATLAQIGDGGLHSVSLEGVAKRAGVTKGAIYDNFESKDALIVAALAELPQDASSPIVWPKGRKGSARHRMRLLGEAVWAGRGDVKSQALGAVEFNLYALMHEDLRNRLAEVTGMGPTRTKQHLLELFSEDELSMPIDAFVVMLHALLPGLAQYRALAPKPPTRDLVIEMFESFASPSGLRGK